MPKGGRFLKLLSWIGLIGIGVIFLFSGTVFASSYISLSVPAHMYPGEPIEIRINASEIKGLQLSLFRIDDPEKYILESKKEYFFSVDTWRPKRPLNQQEKWQNLKYDFFRSLRAVAAKVLSPALKQSLKDILGIEGPIPSRFIEITAADYQRNSSLLKTWWEDITYAKDSSYAYKTIQMNPLQEGVYLLTAAGGAKEARVIFSVTRLSLISKIDQSQLIVFTQDRKTGQILSDVRLRLLKNDTVVADGLTDSQGIWVKSALEKQEMTVLAQSGKEYAFMNIYPYYSGAAFNLDAFLYTERPLYKPGQRVYFKALLREKLSSGYIAPPAGEKVKAVLTDYRENIYASCELVSDQFGNVTSWFDLPISLEEGTYLIQLTWKENDFFRMVSIENYEKPAFEATAKPVKATYANREEVTVQLHASYYSGQPLTPGTFHYQIYRYPVYYWQTNMQTEMIEENTGVLDEKGEAEVKFVPEVKDNAYWYEIQIGVFDAASRGVEKIARVKVLMGDYAFLLQSDRYFVEVNQDLHYTVEARDAMDQKVDVGKVYATIYELNWNKEKKDWDESSVKLFSFAVSSGQAGIDFSMDKAGFYRLVCESQDSKGNKITASDTFYVTGAGLYLPATGVELHLDKKEYRVGETAKVLVVPPVTEKFPHLISIEGEKIYEYEVKADTTGPYEISIPITKDAIMGYYFSLATFFKGSYYNETVQIPVIPEKELSVEISTDKDRYRPQEKGKLKIKISGADLQPRRCDFSLAIVDQAIFDISYQWWERIYDHYYQNFYNKVYTQSSWYEYFYGQGEYVQNTKPQFKGDGRGGAAEPVVRKYFPDTLLWFPNLMTNEQGEAEVEFTCPDSLSSWRVEVRANTPDEFGESVMNFKTSSPFAFRVELPSYLTQGDSIQTQMTLWNEFPRQKVTLEAQSSPELSIGVFPAEVEIDPNQNLVIPVNFQAMSEGTPWLRMYARGELASDAIEVTQSIKPRGVEINQYSSAFVSGGGASLNFEYHPDIFTGIPQTEVILYQNLNSVFYRFMEKMYNYPYGCTEQTSSRMISLVSLPLPEQFDWSKHAPREIQEGIYQLYALQHYDGGWGWWQNDDSNVFNTAHALLALVLAREKGYLVSENALQKAKQYLMDFKEEGLSWEKAFGYYVLTRAGEKPPQLNLSEISATIGKISDKALAWLSLITSGEVHDQIQKELITRVQVAGDSVFYGNSNPEKPWEDDRFLSTCWAVLALHKDNRSLAEKAFLWVLRTIQSDWYINTKETAYFLNIAPLFWEKSQPQSAHFTLKINSEVIHEGQISATDMTKRISIDQEKLRPGTNHIEIQGEGIYLITLNLRGFTTTQFPQSTLAVSKTYWKIKPVKTSEDNFVFAKEAITSLRPGDEILCEIVIDSPNQFDNLVIEDGMAAGFELIRNDYLYQLQDTGDEVTSSILQFIVKKIYDQLPVLFVPRIEAGKNVIRYYLRVRDSGTFYVRPTQVYLMYFPEVRGYSKEYVFESGR